MGTVCTRRKPGMPLVHSGGLEMAVIHATVSLPETLRELLSVPKQNVT